MLSTRKKFRQSLWDSFCKSFSAEAKRIHSQTPENNKIDWFATSVEHHEMPPFLRAFCKSYSTKKVIEKSNAQFWQKLFRQSKNPFMTKSPFQAKRMEHIWFFLRNRSLGARRTRVRQVNFCICGLIKRVLRVYVTKNRLLHAHFWRSLFSPKSYSFHG